jgi:hypothetical protein
VYRNENDVASLGSNGQQRPAVFNYRANRSDREPSAKGLSRRRENAQERCQSAVPGGALPNVGWRFRVLSPNFRRLRPFAGSFPLPKEPVLRVLRSPRELIPQNVAGSTFEKPVKAYRIESVTLSEGLSNGPATRVTLKNPNEFPTILSDSPTAPRENPDNPRETYNSASGENLFLESS